MNTNSQILKYRGWNILDSVFDAGVYFENPWGELEPAPSVTVAKKLIDNFEDVIDQLCAQSE